MRIIALLFILLPWCSLAGPPDTKVQLERMEVIGRFVWDGPVFLKRNAGLGFRHLGEIASESIEEVSNPHAEGSIKYTKLKFKEGLYIFYRSFGTPLRVQFIGITVSSNKWPIKNGLNVGIPVDRVLEVLGEPTKRTPEEFVFSGENDRVTFRIKNERVVEIDFSYYAD